MSSRVGSVGKGKGNGNGHSSDGWRDDFQVTWATGQLVDRDGREIEAENQMRICIDPANIPMPNPPPSPGAPPSPPPPRHHYYEAKPLLRPVSNQPGAGRRPVTSRGTGSSDEEPYGQAACLFGFKGKNVPSGLPIIRCKAEMPPSPPPPPPKPPPPSPSPYPPRAPPPPHAIYSIDERRCALGGAIFIPSKSAGAETPWFVASVVLTRWVAGTTLTLAVRGQHLRLTRVANALYLDEATAPLTDTSPPPSALQLAHSAGAKTAGPGQPSYDGDGVGSYDYGGEAGGGELSRRALLSEVRSDGVLEFHLRLPDLVPTNSAVEIFSRGICEQWVSVSCTSDPPPATPSPPPPLPPLPTATPSPSPALQAAFSVHLMATGQAALMGRCALISPISRH